MCYPQPISDDLRHLLFNNNSICMHFRENITIYNNVMAFTSCKFETDNRTANIGSLQTFIIHGDLYHLQGPLQHALNTILIFAQLYLYNSAIVSSYHFIINDKELHKTILLNLA